MCARPRIAPGETETEHELQRLLVHVIRGLRRSGPPPPGLRRAFGAAGLAPRHVHVLAQLAKVGPVTVSELARRLRLSVPSASLLVSELARAGLAERREDESDRRRTIVAVTDRYREAIDEWLASRSEPLRRALARLTPEEQQALLKALRTIDEELREDRRC
jgi:DNA-binding MarR family transcriptional regulator